MAKKIVWTENAWIDLETVADFIARDSPYYAASFVREIRNRARSLSRMSSRGRVVPEIGDRQIRELFVQSYRLIYKVRRKKGTCCFNLSMHRLSACYRKFHSTSRSNPYPSLRLLKTRAAVRLGVSEDASLKTLAASRIARVPGRCFELDCHGIDECGNVNAIEVKP